MLSFTISSDGEPRASIDVRHRVGADTVLLVVAVLLDEDHEPERISRPMVEARLRQLLHRHGENAYEEWDHRALVGDLEEVAFEVMGRLYPALVK